MLHLKLHILCCSGWLWNNDLFSWLFYGVSLCDCHLSYFRIFIIPIIYAVYHDGTLCMDIIQDAWSPCHNVSTILTSVQVNSQLQKYIYIVYNYFLLRIPISHIVHHDSVIFLINNLLQSLLTDPNAASPANPEAAQLYQHDIQAYNKFVNMPQPIFFLPYLCLVWK